MHRGSSKDVRGTAPATETLPLSASPPKFRVVVEVARGGRSRTTELAVERGTLVGSILRSAGEFPEGCAVLEGETPLPLDAPIERPVRLTVVPTFSGG